MPEVEYPSEDTYEDDRAVGGEPRPALAKGMRSGRKHGEGILAIELVQQLPIGGAVSPNVSRRRKGEENGVGEWMKGCADGFSASSDADISDQIQGAIVEERAAVCRDRKERSIAAGRALNI